MEKTEETKGAEEKSVKSSLTEQPKEEAGSKPVSKSIKSTPVEGKGDPLGSDVSVSSEVIRNEFKDMYGESGEEEEEMDEEDDEEEEGEDEEEEEGDEEEELSEEENLSEFMLQLEEKYMKGIELNEEYLKKENKRIEEVPLHLYAIEIYINSIRTFYGFANHWVRVKIFDSPCVEIGPSQKIDHNASLYPNRSINISRGSLTLRDEVEAVSRCGCSMDVQTEVLVQKRKLLKNKRVDIDMSSLTLRNRRMTIEKIMNEEVTHVGTNELAEIVAAPSKEKDVGLNIPIEEFVDDDDLSSTNLEETRQSRTMLLREPLENGMTIMFPMRPARFINKLQRQPVKIFVLSTSGAVSGANLELSGLTEAVIRASKGPPFPISSMQRFKLITTGDFIAKVVGNVRVIAIGPQNVVKLTCEGNINDQVVRGPPRRSKTEYIPHNLDSREDKPPILTGPQNLTLYDIVMNIRRRRKQKEMFTPPPRPATKRYRVEDLVINRAENTVKRAPKKTFASLRAEIDRYLVLNKRTVPLGFMPEGESITSFEEAEEERIIVEEEVGEVGEGGEEHEMEEEHDEFNVDDKTAKRVEAVFHSLIHSYGQNWANYKPRPSPPPPAAVFREHLSMKRNISQISAASSSIWKRNGNTNPESRKQ